VALPVVAAISKLEVAIWSNEVVQEAKEAQVMAEQFWEISVNAETIRRYWASVSQPKHRTTLCVLLWTAPKELHGGDFMAQWIKISDNYSEAVVCQKGLLIADEALDKVAQWG
jgi:hypothetical protein